jgi:hypothetical protein
MGATGGQSKAAAKAAAAARSAAGGASAAAKRKAAAAAAALAAVASAAALAAQQAAAHARSAAHDVFVARVTESAEAYAEAHRQVNAARTDEEAATCALRAAERGGGVRERAAALSRSSQPGSPTASGRPPAAVTDARTTPLH